MYRLAVGSDQGVAIDGRGLVRPLRMYRTVRARNGCSDGVGRGNQGGRAMGPSSSHVDHRWLLATATAARGAGMLIKTAMSEPGPTAVADYHPGTVAPSQAAKTEAVLSAR